MGIKSITHKVIQLGACIVLGALLTSCFKGQVSVEVNPDETGNYAIAIGLTQQARAFMASSGNGGDPLQSLLREAGQSPNAANITTKRWTEGNYEWVQIGRSFRTLDELNNLVSENQTLVESFKVTRQRGLLKDRFVLDARFKPYSNSGSSSSSVDTSAYIEFQFRAKLPGEIIETNGSYDGRDATAATVWTLTANQATQMHAVSEAWNWQNIVIGGLIASLVLIMALMVLTISVYSFVASPRRRIPVITTSASPSRSRLPSAAPQPERTPAPLPSRQPVMPTADAQIIPPIKNPAAVVVPQEVLQTIGAASLLNDVNRHLLKDLGTLEQISNGLRLIWTTVPGGDDQREINIVVIDQKTLLINGAHFPATYEGVKQGLLKSLQDMNRR